MLIHYCNHNLAKLHVPFLTSPVSFLKLFWPGFQPLPSDTILQIILQDLLPFLNTLLIITDSLYMRVKFVYMRKQLDITLSCPKWPPWAEPIRLQRGTLHRYCCAVKLSFVLIVPELSEPFDTINYKILLDFPINHEICGTTWQWWHGEDQVLLMPAFHCPKRLLISSPSILYMLLQCSHTLTFFSSYGNDT